MVKRTESVPLPRNSDVLSMGNSLTEKKNSSHRVSEDRLVKSGDILHESNRKGNPGIRRKLVCNESS